VVKLGLGNLPEQRLGNLSERYRVIAFLQEEQKKSGQLKPEVMKQLVEEKFSIKIKKSGF